MSEQTNTPYRSLTMVIEPSNLMSDKINPLVSMREATLADLELVNDLLTRAFNDGNDKRTVLPYIQSNHHRCYVIYYDDTIVGTFTVLPHAYRHYHNALCFHTFAICPDMEGQGIGYSVLCRLVSMSHALGEELMFLKVKNWNTQAIHLYRKVGFVPAVDWCDNNFWDEVPLESCARQYRTYNYSTD